jgi:hypothetical protein
MLSSTSDVTKVAEKVHTSRDAPYESKRRPVLRLNVGTKAEKGPRPLQPSVTGTHMLRFEQGQFQCTALNMSAVDGPAEHQVRKHTVTPP